LKLQEPTGKRRCEFFDRFANCLENGKLGEAPVDNQLNAESMIEIAERIKDHRELWYRRAIGKEYSLVSVPFRAAEFFLSSGAQEEGKQILLDAAKRFRGTEPADCFVFLMCRLYRIDHDPMYLAECLPYGNALKSQALKVFLTGEEQSQEQELAVFKEPERIHRGNNPKNNPPAPGHTSGKAAESAAKRLKLI
jgi:hypothetical protein